MTHPVPLDDAPPKVLGRRVAPDPLRPRAGEREEARRWKQATGAPAIPKGLYRFATHEEADAWLWTMLTKPRSR